MSRWLPVHLLPSLPRGLRSVSSAQWALRGVVGAAVLAAVAAVTTAADGMHWAWVLLVVVAALLTLAEPDSVAAEWLLVLLGAGWWVGVERGDHTSPWLLVLALCMVVIHAGTALAASGPPSMALAVRAARRWLLGLGVVGAAVVAAWVLLVGVEQTAVPASSLRLVAALGAVAWLAWYVRSASLGEDDDAPPSQRSG
jgi:hypothetical protein